MDRFFRFLACAWLLLGTFTSPAAGAPTVTVLNGTYVGRYLPGWDQDAFLGIPFAQPPVGPLRFRWPQSLNTFWSGVRNATEYGYSCYQYGSNFSLSEDCLTLNVVRPSGCENTKLPVLVWIYGGGLSSGSSADPRYNLSGIVQTSQAIGRPIIAVSMNYRLGVWGFLQTPEILAEGSSNAGLLDQRMALQWIHENIAAFGGDPQRVTVWGESAGAQSIGLHLTSYGGRNDNLFQAAIMESGGPEGTAMTDLSFYASPYENLTRTVNCWTATDKLACLRGLSSAELYAAETTVVWNPIVDGDFLQDYPSTSIAEGKFVHVPLLIGANTDEGVSFSVKGLNTTTAVFQSLMTWRSYTLSPTSIRQLLELYPDDPASEPPYHITTNETFPQYGLQWRRSAAIGGDLVMIAQRRKVCEVYTSAGQDVYSYRFDTPAWNAVPTDGIPHFVNVAFSFQNISGNLGPLPQYQSYKNLSFDIGRAYVNFVYDHNPNGDSEGGLPSWPKYSLQQPTNMVLNSNGSFVEADTWRKAGITFINTIWRELLS
ncbi:hypothetical protein VTN77DRAFT_6231 [Rasamsonia byssochlamydoides]|uniref:uncharacterized protein n=1 Tax=Rasamsonia byssochlamydoides TaxID=89139 RepID=UPI003743B732